MPVERRMQTCENRRFCKSAARAEGRPLTSRPSFASHPRVRSSIMFRTLAVAMAMCSATLATQAFACETARSPEDRVCQAQAANSAAVAKFQAQISSDAAVHELAVQP